MTGRDPTYTIRRGGAPPVRVVPGGCLRIGRHTSNDLILQHPTVSRFHARVTWPVGAPRPLLEDLGSANGTTADGAVVRRATPLDERSTIAVGDVLLAGELAHPALIADDGRLECRLFTDVAAPQEGLLGAHRTLRDLLLDLERSSRTGTLLLDGGAARAKVTFAAGRIVDATTDARAGLPALHEALERLDRGRFSFRSDVEPHECTLCVSPRELLTQGVRTTERMEKSGVWPGAPRSGRFRVRPA